MSPPVAGGGLSGSPAFPQRPTSGSPIARRPSRGHSERAVGDGTGPVPPPNYVAGGAIGGRMSGAMLRRGSMAIGSNAAPRGVGYGELSDAEETVSKLAAFSPAILLAQLATPPDPAGASAGASPASGHSADATAPWAPSAWQFESAVLFVDVSGFTNLCTRLDVDALQRHINRYFTRLLDVVHTHGGDVLRFMGDAMLVTWALPLPPPAPALAPPPEAADAAADGAGAAEDDAPLTRTPGGSPRTRKREAQLTRHLALLRAAVRAACACALELEEKCGEYEIAELPGTSLSLHCGLGVGRLTAFSVGHRRRAEFLVAGDPIRQIGLAEGCAGRRESVLSCEAWALVGPDASRGTDAGDLAEGAVRGEPVGDDGCVRLLAMEPNQTTASTTTSPAVNLAEALLTSELLSLQSTRCAHRRVPVEAEPSLRAYVHAVMSEAIRSRVDGQIAEQRIMCVCFAKVDGLEERLTAHVGARLAPGRDSRDARNASLSIVQATLAGAQKAIAKSGGALRQFVLDDKGAVVIWTFGLPGSTYEDNARRALQSGFAMVNVLKALGLSPRVGATSGRVFCGLVGAPYRCEYAVMGPCVNLAARLMCACAKHDTRVLCNDELRDRVLALSSRKSKGSRGSSDSDHDDVNGSGYEFVAFDPVPVKGYTDPVAFCLPKRTERTPIPAPRGLRAEKMALQEGSEDEEEDETSEDDGDNAQPAEEDADAADPARSAAATPRLTTYGRETETAALHGATDALARGEGGGIVVLEGEPGSGKSHLLAELEAYCAQPRDGVEGATPEAGVVPTLVAEVPEHDADPLAVWRPVALAALRVHLRGAGAPSDAEPRAATPPMLAATMPPRAATPPMLAATTPAATTLDSEPRAATPPMLAATTPAAPPATTTPARLVARRPSGLTIPTPSSAAAALTSPTKSTSQEPSFGPRRPSGLTITTPSSAAAAPTSPTKSAIQEPSLEPRRPSGLTIPSLAPAATSTTSSATPFFEPVDGSLPVDAALALLPDDLRWARTAVERLLESAERSPGELDDDGLMTPGGLKTPGTSQAGSRPNRLSQASGFFNRPNRLSQASIQAGSRPNRLSQASIQAGPRRAARASRSSRDMRSLLGGGAAAEAEPQSGASVGTFDSLATPGRGGLLTARHTRASGRSALEVQLIVALLRAVFAARRCVVLIDDWHNATPGPTWDVLAGLTGAAAEQPAALFIIASRPLSTWARAGGGAARRAFQQLRASAWTSSLDLAPLAESATALLVQEALSDAAPEGRAIVASAAQTHAIHVRCGGNPLFASLIMMQLVAPSNDSPRDNGATSSVNAEVVETRLQRLCEGVSGSGRDDAATGVRVRGSLLPPGLADIVLSQLDRLSLSEQLVVKMACSLGRRFERSVLQALYPGGAAELDEALVELTHHHYVTCVERLPNDARRVLRARRAPLRCGFPPSR